MRAYLSLGITLLACSALVQAECTCLWQGSFSEVQASTNLVVSGTVVSARGNSIDLKVERLLRGEEPGETVRVWLKTGDYCRPEANLFPLQSQWVMALDEITREVPGGFNPHTPSISYGRLGDFSLSSCGGFWLSQSDERVSGNLVNAPRWDYEPKMTPVLLDLVADYVQGKLDSQALLEASREDPELRELMLDTRSFLRNSH